MFPHVISESFLLALLTASLLKVALECVVWLKPNIKGRVKAARSGALRFFELTDKAEAVAL